MDAAKIIRQQSRILEARADLITELRQHSLTEGGRLSLFGREFVRLAKQNELKQAFVAKLLGISNGAVSQHYNK
jgi:hypothetical protein